MLLTLYVYPVFVFTCSVLSVSSIYFLLGIIVCMYVCVFVTCPRALFMMSLLCRVELKALLR